MFSCLTWDKYGNVTFGTKEQQDPTRDVDNVNTVALYPDVIFTRPVEVDVAERAKLRRDLPVILLT